MNLLIVDDNKNNRLMLRLLLEDYMEENSGVEFRMDEATDGLEALRMCEEKEYSIVFMDIMMPNMDGIEATKLIRQNNKKIMIIAVSAVDDEQRQKEILGGGAEDYVSKPINADIFNTRMSNYLQLLNARNTTVETKKVYTESINLFTKEIYSRHTYFDLSSEDALSELWEYYLLDGHENAEGLSDVVRTVFSLAEVQIKLELQSSLYVEDDEEYKYFSVVNIDKVPPKILQLLLKKNEVRCEYKIQEDKISFKLLKIIIALDSVQAETVVQTIETQEEEPIVISDYTSSKLEVFDYIDPDDMLDLEEFSARLNSLMLIVSGDITEKDAVEIYTNLERIATLLASYPEVYPISLALKELSSTMSLNIDTFIQNSEVLSPMCSAFARDFMNWMEASFHTGAPSVDFMNDTIVVNCQTIESMLKMNDETEASEDMDDIFDF
ncbi:MAG: response regulator [Sulfurimonas sp.]|nr:response regulator [Sulfurimonas sp.]